MRKKRIFLQWGFPGEKPFAQPIVANDVTAMVRKLAPSAPDRWYVYRRNEFSPWCLVHGPTGLSAGHGDTVEEAVQCVMLPRFRKLPEALARAIPISRLPVRDTL